MELKEKEFEDRAVIAVEVIMISGPPQGVPCTKVIKFKTHKLCCIINKEKYPPNTYQKWFRCDPKE